MPGSSRFDAVLARFLAEAAGRGERALAWVRCIVSLPLLLRLVISVAHGERPLQALLIAGGAMALAWGWSLWILRRAGPTTSRLLLSSTLLDVILVGAAIYPSVVWPNPSWTGLLRHTDTGIFLVAITASGFRLSRTAALTGAIGHLLTGLCLLLLEWGHGRAPRIDDVQTVLVLWLAVSLVAWTAASWSIRLVREGARAAVDAELARQQMGAYLSDEVAELVLRKHTLTPGGSQAEVAILFTDLRGFSTYAETRPPERLIIELNAYFDAMVQVIHAHGGVVDKFVGDSLMVVFGAPRSRPVPELALAAVRTGLRLIEALEQHNRDRQARSQLPFEQGIGIHCGRAIAGDIGSRERMQYTVIGDAVNVAARLETQSKIRDAQLLASQAIVDQLPAGSPERAALVPMGEVQLKGRREPVSIWGIPRAGA